MRARYLAANLATLVLAGAACGSRPDRGVHAHQNLSLAVADAKTDCESGVHRFSGAGVKAGVGDGGVTRRLTGPRFGVP
jgi:hypothetical protein